MSELQQLREQAAKEWAAFVEETNKASKHSLKARAARAQYVLTRDAIKALEADYLSFPELV